MTECRIVMLRKGQQMTSKVQGASSMVHWLRPLSTRDGCNLNDPCLKVHCFARLIAQLICKVRCGHIPVVVAWSGPINFEIDRNLIIFVLTPPWNRVVFRQNSEWLDCLIDLLIAWLVKLNCSYEVIIWFIPLLEFWETWIGVDHAMVEAAHRNHWIQIVWLVPRISALNYVLFM